MTAEVMELMEPVPALGKGELVAPGYRVVAQLSRNRTLDVYDVWSEKRQCRCVAKLLRPDKLLSRPARRRLLREGRLLAEFAHPHIVRAYEVLRRPQPVVILETLGGETVAHLIARRRRRMSLRELAYLGLHVSSAIHYLHAHGVLHLDVKPSNVIAHEGRATLIDLSLARPPGPSRGGRGTLGYMAPEQFDHGLLSPATDIWGIGALLYEAATGVAPFRDSGGASRERRADPVAALRRLPEPCAGIIDACLADDPAARPTNSQLYAVLERFATASARRRPAVPRA